MLLTESPDLQSLGVDNPDPTLSHRQSSSTSSSTLYFTQRSVGGRDDMALSSNSPAALPPTPASSSSLATPKLSLNRTRSRSSSSSSDDHFYDAEDGDMQTKRRSVFRSQGSASSPDLATLVRKAKERNGIVQRENAGGPQKESNDGHRASSSTTTTTTTTTTSKGTLSSAPRESTSSNRTRQRSSTTVNSHESSSISSSSKGKLTRNSKQSGESKKSSMDGAISSDWVVTSPRPRSDTLSSKVPTYDHKACVYLLMVPFTLFLLLCAGKVVGTFQDVRPFGKVNGSKFS